MVLKAENPDKVHSLEEIDVKEADSTITLNYIISNKDSLFAKLLPKSD